MMNRYIRGLCGQNDVSFVLAETTQMVFDATTVHGTSSVASAAFGRTLTAVGLMSLFLKGDKASVSLQVKGSNYIKNIYTYGDSHGNVKGYITTPDVGIYYTPEGKLDVGFAVGRLGQLTVIRDYGFGTPYIGQSDLVSGEIAEDLTAYYMYSEQQPNIIALGVHVSADDVVDAAGGMMIQTLPDVSELSIEMLESRLPHFEPITALLLEDLTLEECAARYFGDMPYHISEEGTMKWSCDCTKEKTLKALVSLGEKELQEIIDSGESAVMHCHFCMKDYTFDQHEIEQLLMEAKLLTENEDDKLKNALDSASDLL